MKTLHRILAGVLATSLLATTALATNWSWQSGTNLGATVALSAGQYYSSGNQTEYLLEVGQDDGLTPRVYYGSSLYGRSTMSTLASQLKNQGLTPVAAVNGSFFELSTGLPYGVVITDGVLRSSGSGTAVGFRADGSAVIGSVAMAYEVTTADGTVLKPHVNRSLTNSGGLVLYTNDFDTTTKSSGKAYNVVVKPEKTDLKLGETTTAQVVNIVPDKANCDIPEGFWLLSMTLESDYQYTLTQQLQPIQMGDTVTVTSPVPEGWEDVQFACGGDDMLVVDGVAQTTFKLDSAKRQTGRTAVGIKANGDLVLLATDGLRSSYSAGLTLAQLANRMVELGCVTALNLDGGGSTTMGGRFLGTDKLDTLNVPSDGGQRKCANFIFLTRETTEAQGATNLHLYPYDAAVLAGGAFQLETLASDDNEMVAKVPDNITYTATSGMIGSDGSYTAGNKAGIATVTAKSGKVTGSTEILVVTDPTDMTISVEGTGAGKVALSSGQSANLTASADYKGYDLIAQDHCFTWSVPESLGTIDENGLFQAVETWKDLAGNITVTAGKYQETFPVSITRKPPEGAVILDFEGDVLQGEGAQNTNRAFIQYGKGSGKLTYDVSTQTTATATFNAPTTGGTLGLWVYGDNSNNSLSAKFLAGGENKTLWLTQLNFSGWKWVTATMPEGTTAVTGLYVTAHTDATTDKGTIYVDQMTATNGVMADTTPPTISLKDSGTTITASATDSGSGLATINLSVNGKTVSGTTWTVPQDGTTYQVSAVATDMLGNIARETITIPGKNDSPFQDMTGHWADSYVTYAYDQGYLKGSVDGNGVRTFRPDDTMTRQEFAVALTGFLGVNVTQYENVKLPFTDKNDVASWAESAVKATYDLGLMTGSSVNGTLYGDPNDSITRQEAMVILARTQDKGYAVADLSQFADQKDIATWAQGDIAIMVAQGVIQGDNGKLNPLGNVTRSQVAKMLQLLR